MKNLNKPVKIISLIFQIIFLIGSVAMLAAVIASFAAADSFGNFLLKQTGNGQIATNGFEITLADGNGNVIPAAVRIFSFAGLFSMLCMTMIFRNIYLKNFRGKNMVQQRRNTIPERQHKNGKGDRHIQHNDSSY